MGSEIGLIRVLSVNTARSLVWPVAGAVADRVRGASAGAPGHSHTAVRKLSYVIPQQRAFWEGVVRFTPRLGKGVNYKIGLVGPKVRFKFRKHPKRPGTSSKKWLDQVHRSGLSFGKRQQMKVTETKMKRGALRCYSFFCNFV